MAGAIEELAKDIAELESLEAQSQRQKVKNIISIEIRKLQEEMVKLTKQLEAPKNKTSAPTLRYQTKLTNYAWDQSSKFVKFYITLQNVQSLPSENVFCTFTKKSLELSVKDLDNKDYSFVISNLLHTIVPDESNWKVKSDMILINAAKMEQKNWQFVTEAEMRASEAKKLSTSNVDHSDPSMGLMGLMKNMYDQGDDEMKRTIAKAWHESRAKGPSF